MRRRLTILGLCLACLLVLPFVLVSAAPAADPEPSFWTLQSSGSGASLIGSAVVDSSTCWIVGGGGTILHTVNGGATWAPQSSGTSAALLSAACVGPSRCWAVGEGGAIVATTDGGATWVPQVSGTTIRLTGVDFVDQSHGWATGEASWGGARDIVHTANGGSTWARQTLPAAPPGFTSYSLVSIDFVDPSNGWAVGGNVGLGVVLRTSDGGATWGLQDHTTAGQPLIHVFFLNASTGWAVGEGGVVIHTDNGGTTWSQQPTPTASDLHSVYFTDANNGWAVGVAGAIIHTSDGGSSWTSQASGTGVMLSDVGFADSAYGWATGENGVILRYDASGVLVTSLTPDHAPIGATVVIAGVNLGASGTVRFGETIATTSAWSGTSITCTVPAGLSTGATNVTVTPSGLGASNALPFTVEGPLIASLTPDHAATGDTVVIAGTGLGSAGTVQFGTTAATTSAWSSTSVTCTVPAGLSPGATSVIVTPSGDAASNALPFTVDERTVQMTASVNKTVVGYKGTVKIMGELCDALGTPLPGLTVALQRSTNGTTWSKLKSVTSSSTGSLAAATTIVRKTYFRWSFAGDATYVAGVSPKCSATCRAKLTAPTVPSTVRSGVKYTSSGYLRPQHAGGRAPINISFYRYVSGSWRYQMGGTWSNWDNVSGATRYKIWFRLGTNDAGRWRVRAMHRDADHAKTYSPWRYFTVY